MLAQDTQKGNKLCILKVYNKGGNVSDVLNKCRMMKKLEHRHVLKVYEFGKMQISQNITGVKEFYAIEEYAANGSLYEKINFCDGVSEPVARYIFK